jgi:hypothetical protein
VAIFGYDNGLSFAVLEDKSFRKRQAVSVSPAGNGIVAWAKNSREDRLPVVLPKIRGSSNLPEPYVADEPSK